MELMKVTLPELERDNSYYIICRNGFAENVPKIIVESDCMMIFIPEIKEMLAKAITNTPAIFHTDSAKFRVALLKAELLTALFGKVEMHNDISINYGCTAFTFWFEDIIQESELHEYLESKKILEISPF